MRTKDEYTMGITTMCEVHNVKLKCKMHHLVEKTEVVLMVQSCEKCGIDQAKNAMLNLLKSKEYKNV